MLAVSLGFIQNVDGAKLSLVLDLSGIMQFLTDGNSCVCEFLVRFRVVRIFHLSDGRFVSNLEFRNWCVLLAIS